MKDTLKKAKVLDFMRKGYFITQRIAMINFEAYRLSSIINRFRNDGMWIIDHGKSGEHSEYLLLRRGKYWIHMILGFRFRIENASYIYDDNGHYKDMDVLLTAENGNRKVRMLVNQDAFRRESGKHVIMENKLKEALS